MMIGVDEILLAMGSKKEKTSTLIAIKRRKKNLGGNESDSHMPVPRPQPRGF